jgi:hypothetical protein
MARTVLEITTINAEIAKITEETNSCLLSDLCDLRV